METLIGDRYYFQLVTVQGGGASHLPDGQEVVVATPKALAPKEATIFNIDPSVIDLFKAKLSEAKQ